MSPIGIMTPAIGLSCQDHRHSNRSGAQNHRRGRQIFSMLADRVRSSIGLHLMFMSPTHVCHGGTLPRQRAPPSGLSAAIIGFGVLRHAALMKVMVVEKSTLVQLVSNLTHVPPSGQFRGRLGNSSIRNTCRTLLPTSRGTPELPKPMRWVSPHLAYPLLTPPPKCP